MNLKRKFKNISYNKYGIANSLLEWSEDNVADGDVVDGPRNVFGLVEIRFSAADRVADVNSPHEEEHLTCELFR